MRGRSGDIDSLLTWLARSRFNSTFNFSFDRCFNFPVMNYNPQTDQATDQEEHVRDEKYVIVKHAAVNDEACVREDLADVKPLRYPTTCLFRPLLVNLLADRQQQDERARPANDFLHLSAGNCNRHTESGWEGINAEEKVRRGPPIQAGS